MKTKSSKKGIQISVKPKMGLLKKLKKQYTFHITYKKYKENTEN